MKIDKSKDLYQMVNLHNKPNKTDTEKEKLWNARKNDAQLDRILYQSDMNKLYEETFKAENLAKKLARGEALTDEEKAFLERVNPELLKEAQRAKEEGERLKQSLKNAKSQQEAHTIVEQAQLQANMVAKHKPQYAMLLKEAIKAACNEKDKATANIKPYDDKISNINNINENQTVLDKKFKTYTEEDDLKISTIESLVDYYS